MLSNENLLNAQNAYITQLQEENDALKAKLRKAANDFLAVDTLRMKQSESLERMGKLVEEMRATSAQRYHNDEIISQLRRHNVELRAELERLRKTAGYTGVPMQVAFDGKTFQNNEDGLKGFAQAIQDAEREELKDTLDRYSKQFKALSEENRRLEQHLRSAENALKEKDAELKALRNAGQVPHKIVLATPEEREEALKCLREVDNNIIGFLDRIMKR